MSSPPLLDFPPHLQAPGTADVPFEPALPLAELPRGALVRITRGDLDVLVAHTDAGIVATDDRCPHMSAPFSAGRLEGCTLHCPLHRGAFDVCDGDVVTFPTTGGLTADGGYRPTWTPEGSRPKPPLRPDDAKAQARRLTRVRRLRFYPLRIEGDMLQIALPG
ncbi:MAG: Rieske (2Fe-2S) protein [Chloroflexota bacterium]|jgi:nitrite reductase/ring-hydroxylating ferredoxin subunit